MQAIEFVGEVEDGAIKIPHRYLQKVKEECRVIILVEEAAPQKIEKRELTAMRIRTKGFKFNRDVVSNK